jgi:hypothetical protein
MITVGMNHRASYVHPGQSSSNHVDAGFFKHFSDGTVGRVLAGFHDAGDRGPCQVVGALYQKHLLIADDHCRRTWQPQWRLSDVPTKFDDEFGDRHAHVFSRDRDRGAANTVVSCSARFLQGPCQILLSTHQPPWAAWVKRSKKGIAMTLKKIVGMVGIAGALGFSAIGLSGVANAATTPQATPGLVQQAQLAGWGGPGGPGAWHRPGGPGGWHGPGWGGPGGPGAWHGPGGPGGWGGPGWGGPGGPGAWHGPGGPGGWGGPGWRGPGWGGPGWRGPGWGGPGWGGPPRAGLGRPAAAVSVGDLHLSEQ